MTAGSAEDWLEEDLIRLVVNAVYSLTGLEEEIPEKSDVGLVGEYEPSATGALSDGESVGKGVLPE